ncbi:hypothetical protein T265_04346 [Opisthorchis viverrini]|uniref:Uncharacterized protein n=1 Tax=Opisthorchis viverrini TaxID=6198 RepID=A0A074ZZY8_OPIVI|nr:hypothetical protein T265_04346 [Opisthorchis viverrini]KER28875.1 hypothetical protein T265_04346 [Opisthorchis viverrini]
MCCPPRGLRHPEGGTENNTRLGRRGGKGASILDELTKFIPSFCMYFAPTNCKVLLVDMQSLNTPLTIQGEGLDVVEFYVSWNSDFIVIDEVNTRICKAQFAFANLRRLWRQGGVSVHLKEHVYQATVRAVSLYG